jgi:hypothetical protein
MSGLLKRKYAGVTAFVGMPGSGKTYGLAQVADRALRRGETVFSNEGFDVEGTECLRDWHDFAEVRGPAVIVWDELPLYFNSRRWQEFPDGFLYRLTQVRKDGLQLYYSAIHEEMIDVNLRRMTFWYWHCRAITQRWLRRSMFPPEQFRRAKSKPYRSEFVVVRDRVASLYDTTRKVELPERIKARHAEQLQQAQERAAKPLGGDAGSPGGGAAPQGQEDPPGGRTGPSVVDSRRGGGRRLSSTSSSGRTP